MERGIVLVGLNHRTAPVEVRERVAFANGRLEPALRDLVALPGILEGAIVSTCNRVEVIACGVDVGTVGGALPAFLAREHGLGEPALAGHPYTHADRAAARHLFRVGAGAMGELTARQLLAQGVGSVLVVNRTYERAMDVARELGGMPVPFERLARYLPLADLVIGTASGDEFLVTPALVDEAMRERRRRPMLFVDLAVPRGFDPGVNAIDDVYLFDIDDLESVVADNKGARAREAVKAETIIDAEVDAFWRWFTSLDVVPTIVALRDKVEGIRRREVARGLTTLGDADPRLPDVLERVTSAIVNKILHGPLTALRRHEAQAGEAFYVEAARRLFRLGADPDDEEE